MSALRFGTGLTGARTRGYAYLVYTEFPDQDALKADQAHPVHQRFLAFNHHLDATTVLGPEPEPTPKESS